VPDSTVYLFDGYNLLHAGAFADARELVDTLASFVAVNGARGVVVFDGVGEDYDRGPLQVRHAVHADTLLESLAFDHRSSDRVILVTSDSTVAAAAGPVWPSFRPRPSSATSRRRRSPRRRRAAWPASSTTRRAPVSSVSAEASKQLQLQQGLVLFAKHC